MNGRNLVKEKKGTQNNFGAGASKVFTKESLLIIDKRIQPLVEAAEKAAEKKDYSTAAKKYEEAFNLEPGPADKLKYCQKAEECYKSSGNSAKAEEMRTNRVEIEGGGVFTACPVSD